MDVADVARLNPPPCSTAVFSPWKFPRFDIVGGSEAGTKLMNVTLAQRDGMMGKDGMGIGWSVTRTTLVYNMAGKNDACQILP